MRLAEAHHLIAAALRAEYHDVEHDDYDKHYNVRQYVFQYGRLRRGIICICKRIILRRYLFRIYALGVCNYGRHIRSERIFVGYVADKVILLGEQILIRRAFFNANYFAVAVFNGLHRVFLCHGKKIGIFDLLIIRAAVLKLRKQNNHQHHYGQIDKRSSQLFTQFVLLTCRLIKGISYQFNNLSYHITLWAYVQMLNMSNNVKKTCLPRTRGRCAAYGSNIRRYKCAKSKMSEVQNNEDITAWRYGQRRAHGPNRPYTRGL